MSTAAPLHNIAEKSPLVSKSSHSGLLLQRKCACGLPKSSLSGECEECKGTKRLQTKLAIGSSNDPLEMEADRIADQVLAASHKSMLSTVPPRIQRSTGQSTGDAGAAPASVERVLSNSGRPLEPPLRQDMEQRFGHDFSQVRVHADAAAAQSARDVRAHAYTAGSHIVFGASQFSPSTPAGRHLLAHELTHVLQQSAHTTSPGIGGGNATIMRKGFESTVEICHRVLKTRQFKVENGGLRVILAANSPYKGVPNCDDFNFGVSLSRSEDWWIDKEIGTCEASTGGTRVFTFGNLPVGTYYLTIWRTFDNPNCCLEGDIMVFDEAAANDSAGCHRAKDLSTMDIVHGALDLAGFIPALGAIPDGINAGIYVVEGDWANAGLSAVAMVPMWGDGVKLATMAGKSTIRVTAKAAIKLGPDGIAKGLKEVKAASKATKVETELAQQISKEAAEKIEKEAAAEAIKKGTPSPKKKPTKPDGNTKKKEKPKEKDKKKKGPKCSEAEITLMNKALHVFCDKPRRCSMQADTCETATAKVAAGYGCIDGRVVLQQKCFSPGDPQYESHMQQIAQASAALRNCLAVVAEKCS
ncbi:eCIS core domain-containing protein [Candidatus Nitrotoga sp. M5]|uniref:eCIS core domain-containing protein n=1 Tax=Candidatus Nitrotoga sp. M5 TaxID=2890409 RepID=UPI001EF69727|nr:DUF4157 domain-containing protein [Candidatus Nitrotoga sp. M5]CAH1388054.1 hypothetical protein NTGM5_80021 [Candidatus Nitrotoga sp. M5]